MPKKIDDYLKNNGITQCSTTSIDTLFCTESYQCTSTSQVLLPAPPPPPQSPFPTARSLTRSSAGTLLAHRPCSSVEQESPYCTVLYVVLHVYPAVEGTINNVSRKWYLIYFPPPTCLMRGNGWSEYLSVQQG